jgi:peptide/nickel transport system permease protein
MLARFVAARARRAQPPPSPDAAADDDVFVSEYGSWMRQVLARVLASPNAIIGLTLLGVVALLAIAAPLVSRYDPDFANVVILNNDPSGSHWLGTDYLGRDVWSRVVYGGRNSLPAGFFVALIGMGIGTPMGMAAGYGPRALDNAIMRFVDVLLCIPSILLAIGIVSLVGPSLRSSIIAVGVTAVPGFARLARASSLRARELEYVDSARAMGAGAIHVLRRHILPNIADQVVVLASLTVGYAILATAALSFLGLGSQPPAADWGTMISKGYQFMFQSWSQVAFPGLAIMVTVLGINLFGDALNDALNPRIQVGK